MMTEDKNDNESEYGFESFGGAKAPRDAPRECYICKKALDTKWELCEECAEIIRTSLKSLFMDEDKTKQ